MKCVVLFERCDRKEKTTKALINVCKEQKRIIAFARYGPGFSIFECETEKKQRAELNRTLTDLENKINLLKQGMLTTTPEVGILALMEQGRACVRNFLNTVDSKQAKLFGMLEEQRRNLELELGITKKTTISVVRESDHTKMNICCLDLLNLLYLLNPESLEISWLLKEKTKERIVLDQIKEKPELHGQDLAGEIITQLTINREIKLKKGVPTNWDMKESYLRYEDIMKEEAEGKIGAILNSIAYKTNNIFEFSLLT